MGMRTNALFLITLTCGTILVVLLSIVISTGSAKPKQVPSVMYFAIYLGDEEDGVQSCGPAATSERKNCSFHLNVNNTRSSILFIQNRNQQYSFILYDENARSTPPLKALDAIALLTTIEPIPGRFFNQTSAIEEFARQGSVEDKLVHYIPCRYDYSEDKDKEQFLEVMEQFGLHERTMLVSNTHSAEIVAVAYNHSQQYVAGEGTNIVERIQSFGAPSSTTPLATPTRIYYSTTGTPFVNNITTSSTSVITAMTITAGNFTTTAVTEVNRTTEAIKTSTNGGFTSDTTTMSGATTTLKSTIAMTTRGNVTGTTVSSEPTIKVNLTTSTTSTSVSVSTTTPMKFSTVEPTSIANSTPMDSTIQSTAISIDDSFTTASMSTRSTLESSTSSGARSTTPSRHYSTTGTSSAENITAPSTSAITTMTATVDNVTTTAATEVNPTTETTETSTDGGSTSNTITISGATRTLKSTFSTATRGDVTSTTVSSEPTIEVNLTTTSMSTTSTLESSTSSSVTTPSCSYSTSRTSSTVESTSAVNFTTKMDSTTKLTATSIYGGPTTTSMSTMSSLESTSQLNRSTESTTTSYGRSYTATAPTSTPALSTTSQDPTASNVHCIFVGDLRNFATSHNAYEKQKVFIGEISKSVFQATPNASAGLWVYGFTNFDRDPAKTIDRMRVNYEAFLDDLNKNMEIHDHLNKRPLDSKTAAREINKVDYKGKANCITFFAGVRSAGDMGHLNPEKLDEPKRVVLVSLRGVNLTTKVDEPKGAAVIVSKNYTTDDVSRVVNSILSVFK